MKKILQFFRNVFCAKSTRYKHYIVVVTEKYSLNRELPDNYISGYVFATEEEAQAYADWLMEHTAMYDSAVVDEWNTNLYCLTARLTYPVNEGDKLKVSFIQPLRRGRI